MFLATSPSTTSSVHHSLIFFLEFLLCYVHHKQNNIENLENLIEDIIPGITLITLGIIFALSMFMTMSRLKKYFKDFYTEHKCMLLIPALGLSLPMIFRGTLIFLNMIEAFNDWTDSWLNVYIFILYLIGDVIPLSFQLSSLIFGYLRIKKDKK